MDKSTFEKTASEYIKNIATDKPFKLKDILGNNCPAYPGQWLCDDVQKRLFDTSEYVVKLVGKDYSDTYIKKSLNKDLADLTERKK
jgi:hypothetical protein